MTTTAMPKPIHEGRNVKRIREMLGIKQDALAIELGDDWTQKKISLLEAKESIEPELLEQLAKALKIPPDAIRNFNEEAAVNIIANTINNHDNASVYGHYSFNPIDKIVELYERMIKEKDEKITLLEKLLAEGNPAP